MDLISLLFGGLLEFGSWEIEDRQDVPADVLSLADPMDPWATSILMDAIFTNVPDGFIRDTCLVESGCRKPLGVHKGDAKYGKAIFERIQKRLRPDCRYHDVEPEEVSTRGNHGLMWGYQVVHLGRGCIPTYAFDVPLLSAIAAGRKADYHCRQLKARGLRCTRLRLRCAWGNAPLRTQKCGRAIKRWRKALKRRRAERPGFDWNEQPTLRQIRRTRNG